MNDHNKILYQNERSFRKRGLKIIQRIPDPTAETVYFYVTENKHKARFMFRVAIFPDTPPLNKVGDSAVVAVEEEIQYIPIPGRSFDLDSLFDELPAMGEEQL